MMYKLWKYDIDHITKVTESGRPINGDDLTTDEIQSIYDIANELLGLVMDGDGEQVINFNDEYVIIITTETKR